MFGLPDEWSDRDSRQIMEAAPGFEPGIKALQASALPLGHAAGDILERETRFELATLALARRCSTTELFPHHHNAGAETQS